MNGLRVRSPGLFTTVQDRGRHGFRNTGVPTAGALDLVALRLANALVGNAPEAAALECIGLGPELEATEEDVRIAFLGDAPQAAVHRADGSRQPLPPGQSTTLRAGDRLAIGSLRGTFSLVVAVEGGIDVPPVLGSRATYVRSGFGGLSGRMLQPGDIVPVGAAASKRAERRLTSGWDEERAAPVRVVLGPQDDAFTPDGIADFLAAPWVITSSSDRMGFRFEGPRLAHKTTADIVSDGAVNGSIQVPGSGQPIVLLADGQSVGGYTKIATVISADIPRLVRHKPGESVRFAAVSQEQGEEIARAHERWLQEMTASIDDFFDGLNEQALYERNLVSGVVAAS